MDKIIILDFGSQTAQLIGRRIRDMGVYTEILPGDAELGEVLKNSDVKGVILSGSPDSVNGDGCAPDRKLYDSGLPLLGICYGLQRMTVDFGGKVETLPKQEYGRITVTLKDAEAGGAGIAGGNANGERAALFLKGFRPSFTAWISHSDSLTVLAPGFREFGTTESGFPAIVIHDTKPWFGLQFHPELTHCENGDDILSAFTLGVCGCEAAWTMESYIEETRASLKAQTGGNPVLLLISGGVDSTVTGAMLLSALDKEQVHLMYMDTGLMRKDETKTVKAILEKLGAKHLHIVMCENEFLAALKGITEPEAKRKAIGDLFITLQEREVARLGLPENYFLAQGTLYTDLIESGGGVGKKARLIKSHHNVGTPLVEAKRKAGRIIEPLDKLYKDEVRRLGRLLGVDEEVIRRHPFPGPGLAVRVIGEVTKERCDILREADAVFIDELKRRCVAGSDNAGEAVSLYDDIWQAFAVLLPIRSVGVTGDSRKYGSVLALRAISSTDGMSADVYPFETRDLLEISSRITNTVKDIGRVTYDISSKPPATIEWE
ncbi:MAG TPA: glutamine-hydrolyzing GMP synthase [Treponema sp.]|nr:glutamine-hydrolyzing GMP synthase [Treponema sp.]